MCVMKYQKAPSFTSSLVHFLHLYQLKLYRVDLEKFRPRTAALSTQNRKAKREAAASTDRTVTPGSLYGSESIFRTFGL